jgi:flagellar protein FlaJ
MPEIGVIAFWETLQDPVTINPCLDWEYWEPELIDKSKPGNGCPEYATRIFPVPLKFLILALGGAIIPFAGFRLVKGGAKREADKRGAQIEKYLPYAASYTAAMSAANATPAKIFRSLAMNKDIYGDVSEDAGLIYRDVTLLGYDLITAIKLSVDRAASIWLTEFFQGMVGTLSSGGYLKLYFLNRAEHYMRENRTRLQQFLETIALLAESYIVVAVAMPLFLIVMLVIMFWVSGSGAQMSEGMLYGIVLVFIPMIHLAYAVLVYTSSKEQEM